MEEESKIGS